MSDLPPIVLPGVQAVDPDSSDSDPEAVAARKLRKQKAFARIQREEAEQEESEKAAVKRKNDMADVEQVLAALCSGEAQQILDFMSGIGCVRPESYEDRLKMANELREKGKTLFKDGDNEMAARHWLSAVHCLDFTPRSLQPHSKGERKQVLEAMGTLISNLSVASRKMGDPAGACKAADIGLQVIQKMPFAESKALRVKLRLHHAIAKGEQRDFAGAGDDARHVLQLCPGHEEATRIARNSGVALRREKGPGEHRWKGPLTIPIPKKKKASSDWSWKLALVIIGPLLAFFMFIVMRLGAS